MCIKATVQGDTLMLSTGQGIRPGARDQAMSYIIKKVLPSRVPSIAWVNAVWLLARASSLCQPHAASHKQAFNIPLFMF